MPTGVGYRSRVAPHPLKAGVHCHGGEAGFHRVLSCRPACGVIGIGIERQSSGDGRQHQGQSGRDRPPRPAACGRGRAAKMGGPSPPRRGEQGGPSEDQRPQVTVPDGGLYEDPVAQETGHVQQDERSGQGLSRRRAAFPRPDGAGRSPSQPPDAPGLANRRDVRAMTKASPAPESRAHSSRSHQMGRANSSGRYPNSAWPPISPDRLR